MKKNRSMGVGSVSLVLIFCALCLTVFALLTLSSANNEKKLATKLADSTSGYYAADLEATEVLSEIKLLLESGESLPDTINCVNIKTEQAGTDRHISYRCAIDENRVISVALEYDAGSLTVTSWKETEIKDWNPDDSIDVWQG